MARVYLIHGKSAYPSIKECASEAIDVLEKEALRAIR